MHLGEVVHKSTLKLTLKSGQAGQIGPNLAKRDQTGTKLDQMGPNWTKQSKRGQIGPNGSKGADFLHVHIFLREEKVMFGMEKKFIFSQFFSFFWI